jgi:hypothetical protein
MNIDIFNGDADGICALIQLRLAYPAEARLITGVKRDIGLLNRLSVQPGDQLTVLDISLNTNRAALLNLLKSQITIFYADHHYCGDIPQHPALTTLIDTNSNICTSLLVNTHVQYRFPEWAIVGAFGDNLADSAHRLAKHLCLTTAQLQSLQTLGICINYNAYGRTIDDLHIAPDLLYRILSQYRSPLDFIAEQAALFQRLITAHADDIDQAETVIPEFENSRTAIFMLPNEKWAHRVVGVWGNELANRHPDKAHALLIDNAQGGYQVSVRAPLNIKMGADELCGKFSTGGGRKTAAGINHLEKDQLSEFIRLFETQYN